MQIQLEVKNPQKALALLEFLKALGLVDRFSIVDPGPEAPNQQNQGRSFFEQFYGSAKTGRTPEEIDQQLEELRKEWERDI